MTANNVFDVVNTYNPATAARRRLQQVSEDNCKKIGRLGSICFVIFILCLFAGTQGTIFIRTVLETETVRLVRPAGGRKITLFCTNV